MKEYRVLFQIFGFAFVLLLRAAQTESQMAKCVFDGTMYDPSSPIWGEVTLNLNDNNQVFL
jgi:hypothetical protein